jgi:hypothetical protein
MCVYVSVCASAVDSSTVTTSITVCVRQCTIVCTDKKMFFRSCLLAVFYRLCIVENRE